ncbi:hypothetical protein GLOTRDRAFT_130581 [Gloeophyllum trabeum ATCC 11539]|uniref:F-box domain-containing protein n=1 Tax=Gloeophyllum trabeum (strain ATCC 11539 / FP-39264 / Madison 617) TaxID=670483 RepID=S7Q403_GLOTA|nr:uncharacterized protein GLOTRDRAFT_130581 [Gloeophyllum trabeum ATCC 11539]EPQ54198.1 hypothetical protein GLOTRDRAFT_130581 [Gloeophyllum trabeum ATCC 11539]
MKFLQLNEDILAVILLFVDNSSAKQLSVTCQALFPLATCHLVRAPAFALHSDQVRAFKRFLLSDRGRIWIPYLRRIAISSEACHKPRGLGSAEFLYASLDYGLPSVLAEIIEEARNLARIELSYTEHLLVHGPRLRRALVNHGGIESVTFSDAGLLAKRTLSGMSRLRSVSLSTTYPSDVVTVLAPHASTLRSILIVNTNPRASATGYEEDAEKTRAEETIEVPQDISFPNVTEMWMYRLCMSDEDFARVFPKARRCIACQPA